MLSPADNEIIMLRNPAGNLKDPKSSGGVFGKPGLPIFRAGSTCLHPHGQISARDRTGCPRLRGFEAGNG